jgi:hypothetical protein
MRKALSNRGRYVSMELAGKEMPMYTVSVCCEEVGGCEVVGR